VQPLWCSRVASYPWVRGLCVVPQHATEQRLEERLARPSWTTLYYCCWRAAGQSVAFLPRILKEAVSKCPESEVRGCLLLLCRDMLSRVYCVPVYDFVCNVVLYPTRSTTLLLRCHVCGLVYDLNLLSCFSLPSCHLHALPLTELFPVSSPAPCGSCLLCQPILLYCQNGYNINAYMDLVLPYIPLNAEST